MDSIIFDLDGTLWDSTDNVVKSWKEIISKNKATKTSIDSEKLKKLFGLELKEIADILFYDLKEEDRYNLIKECCDNENEYLSINGGVLYENLEYTLEKLHEKYKLYIVSNCQSGYIESFFKAHNLSEYFDEIECNGNTGLSKAECIKLIIKRNNLINPVYVGDTQRDLDSAAEANIPFVFASYGFGSVNHYDYYIKSIRDLIGINFIDKYRDGHVHSPYCPHGSDDSFDMYIKMAINKNIKEITFTEHMDYNFIFTNKSLMDDIAPCKNDIRKYFKEIDILKVKYNNIIKINKGLEVDFIEGYEEKIRENLNEYGNDIEDGILSVHFVKYEGKYYAIDLLADFEALLKETKSLEKIYDLYYQTVIKAIKSDLGLFKPRRIGHISLVRIFNKKYPLNYNDKGMYEKIIKALCERDYEIDVNTSGLRKEFCLETYPSGKLLEMINMNNIKKVYGSDAHNSKDIGKDFR